MEQSEPTLNPCRAVMYQIQLGRLSENPGFVMMSRTTSNTSINPALSIENMCPVCGFEMDYEPADYNICPSCGTEFGVSDFNATISDLREAWLETGPSWWYAAERVPLKWNPTIQLQRLQSRARKLEIISYPFELSKRVRIANSLSNSARDPQEFSFNFLAPEFRRLACASL